MPRITRVVIRPKIGQPERGHIVSNLVEQLKRYYRQTSEETLLSLAITMEKQAFGHAQTREQYSDNLKCLSSQEMEHANQLYEEISGRTSCPEASSAEAGMEITSSSASDHGLTTCNGDSDGLDGNLSEKYKKVRQKLARQRIIARQRKRARPISNSVHAFCQEVPPLETEEHTCDETEKSSTMQENAPSDLCERVTKRPRTDSESSTADTLEWYNSLFDSTDSDIGSSFLKPLSASEFGLNEDCDDIETCLSSTGSRA